MMNLAGVSPAPAAIRVGTTPPTAPLPPSATPPTARPSVSSTLVVDLTEASRLTSKAVEMIGTLPQDDIGSESTKDSRVRIYKTNLAAQKRLEQQFDATGNDSSVVSALRQADAYLEDSNWQLAKKPSPDGRFTGVDIPGALRDASEGARVIAELLASAGGHPSTPAPFPPDPPVHPPAGPPPGGAPTPIPPGGLPPLPGGGGGAPGTPWVPPTEPDAPGQPSGPGGPPPGEGPGGQLPPGQVDPDYPGEDEFPKDDDILGGGDN